MLGVSNAGAKTYDETCDGRRMCRRFRGTACCVAVSFLGLVASPLLSSRRRGRGRIVVVASILMNAVTSMFYFHILLCVSGETNICEIVFFIS